MHRHAYRQYNKICPQRQSGRGTVLLIIGPICLESIHTHMSQIPRAIQQHYVIKSGIWYRIN